DLRDKYGIPYLFITHDIAVARYVSDRLAVMYLGRVVELADTETAIFEPKHPYTQALLSAVPVPDPDAKHGRIKIKGEVPSAANVPLGCRFRPRCPKAFKDCGWQAVDMMDWLERQGLMREGTVLGDSVGQMEPGGFILQMKLRDGADTASVIATVKDIVERAKEQHPIAQAVESVDSVLADRYLEIRCQPTTITDEEVACELLSLLESTVTFREADHPMHGIISDMKQDGNRLRISVGEGEKNAKVVEAFIEDYVRHHKRRNRPEFKGVRSISAEGGGSVVVTCRNAKEPAKEVANDVALHVEKCAMGDERLFSRLFPVEVRGRKARVRVMGTEEDWKRLESALRSYFEKTDKAGEDFGRMISGIKWKKAKGARNVVAVRFTKSKDPPLYDVGGGHMVACLLYKDQVAAPSPQETAERVSGGVDTE
ncbi:TPA: ABC transporter ATP-binding protein, partial [Thermoplasmata archaeon]|nr:ABC transporter ATP-binding protein [Thermoplasmata archaeon]